jgi:predicted RND superfamily exporter protein
VSTRDISSPRYLGRIQKLTQQINAIDEVSAVKSLAEGPKSFQDALASPFWSRLLIADRKSSNVLVFLENKDPEKPIKRIERIMHELDETDFRIHIAGPPYVVEMIRRSLAHDFWYFSLTAVVLFGLTMAAMFRFTFASPHGTLVPQMPAPGRRGRVHLVGKKRSATE